MDRYDDFCGDQSVSEFVQVSKDNGHQTPEGAARSYVDGLLQDGRIDAVAEDEGIDREELQGDVYDAVLARIAPEWGDSPLRRS